MLQGLPQLLVAGLLALGGGEPPAERAKERLVLEAARDGGWSAHLEVMDAIARPGREGEAAVLALALCEDAGVYSWLVSLFEDGAGGRQLAGDNGRPVPIRLRAVSAVALGARGHPVGLGVLRRVLDDHDSDTRLRRAAFLGLSLSPFECDRQRVSAARNREAVSAFRHPASPDVLLELAALARR